VLDFEIKTSYAVAVTVDDPTMSATPDATSTYAQSQLLQARPSLGRMLPTRLSHVAANSVTWFESAGHTIIQPDVNGDAIADLRIM
jgi:hypothetical protein